MLMNYTSIDILHISIYINLLSNIIWKNNMLLNRDEYEGRRNKNGIPTQYGRDMQGDLSYLKFA